ncbi:hypothetical protein DUI87_04029 [Hirundo rustica rustica]|uniref:Reverse transcriptase domain-containing protein n=1 Tax=Hirundo rustica rustica TaxID=333673 RepID=A0A3M0L1T0_HIRRU|nr:hypothetical protein DUI87_04029 [Hirundo rustica rustica]
MKRQICQAWHSLWSLRNTGLYRPGWQFSPLDSKIPSECCKKAPPNGKLPQRVTTCSWKTDPGDRDWNLFLHQKGQSQAKGVIGKEGKGTLEFWSIPGPVLFITLINYINSRMQCTFNRFMDDVKLSDAVDVLGVRIPCRGTLMGMRIAHVNLMNFIKTKCNVLHGLMQSPIPMQTRL